MKAGPKDKSPDQQKHRDRAAPSRLIAPFVLTAFAGITYSDACHAQATTVYSFDDSNRVIQVISSTGAGVQYQYDAAGNTTAVNAISAAPLAQGTPDTATFSTPGQPTLISLSITAGQPVVLTVSSLTTIPSNSPVIVNVYNSAGSLVDSLNTSAGTSIDLSSLPPGAYSVIVVPTGGATGSVTLALNPEPAGGSSTPTDGPIPIWALVALGAGLVGIGFRNEKRLRRLA